jgi:hypothetical protein
MGEKIILEITIGLTIVIGEMMTDVLPNLKIVIEMIDEMCGRIDQIQVITTDNIRIVIGEIMTGSITGTIGMKVVTMANGMIVTTMIILDVTDTEKQSMFTTMISEFIELHTSLV